MVLVPRSDSPESRYPGSYSDASSEEGRFELSHLDVWSYTRKEFDTVKFSPRGRGDFVLDRSDVWGGFYLSEGHSIVDIPLPGGLVGRSYAGRPIENGRILRVGFRDSNGQVKNMSYAWFLRKGKPKAIDDNYNPLEETVS